MADRPKRRRAPRSPEAALLDAQILANGRPNARNRRRMQAAKQALSAAITARLDTLGTETLGQVA